MGVHRRVPELRGMFGSKATLSLSLLGPPQIDVDGQPVSAPLSAKAQALLAYLAVESALPHQRDALAGLLWPDHAQDAARNSLRQALHQLRRALGKASPPFLLISRQAVRFNPASHYSLDVTDFSALIRQCDSHSHRRREACRGCIKRLQTAVELYRGKFMAGFFLKDSGPFEEWALVKREQLARQAIAALHTLAEYHALTGSYEAMEELARRQIEADPFREDAHRQVMRALGWRGQRNAALSHYRALSEMLAEELAARPDEATTALHAQIASESLESLEPSELRNWPAYLTPFVGREPELAQIAEYLQASDVPLLTIVGPGGMGKTRLALQAAAREVYAFRDGACFVSLAEVGDPESAVSAVGSALGLTFHDSADPKEQLLSYLRNKDLLLLLDGAEHLLERSQLVGDLLSACPTVKVLAASGEGLNLRQEYRLPIQGLPSPSPGTPADPEAHAAVQLFVQRARQLRPGFELSEANRLAVARICRLVGGMPLALELAAGWSKVLSCAQIAEQIGRSMDFLVTRLRDTPDRHRSLRAVFEHSWSLLDQEEQQVLRQLAVFRGGFSLSAAEEIVALEGSPSADRPGHEERVASTGPLHAVLSSLADKSLLQIGATGRYEQHAVVRQYAEERLAESGGELEEARERHANYFASMLQRCQQQFRTGERPQAAAEIGQDIENVRAAWRWAVAGRRWQKIGQCLSGLMLFYRAHGWWLEGEAALGQAIAALKEAGPDATAEDPVRAVVLGAAVAYRGTCCVYLGRYEEAEKLLLEGLPPLQSAGARGAGLAVTLGMLGCAELFQGKHEVSGEHLRQGLAAAEESGDRWHIALLHLLSGHHARRRDPAEAAEHYRASLSIFRELGDLRSLASAQHALGIAVLSSGRLAEAQENLEEGLAVARRAESQQVEGWSLAELGNVACETGDVSRARDCYEQSLAIAAEIADVRTVINARLGAARLLCAQQDYQAAKEEMLAPLRMAAEARAWPQMVTGMICWAECLAGQGRVQQEQAVGLLAQVLAHPLTWEEQRIRAKRLLKELRTVLPSDLVDQLLERGGAGTLETTIKDIAGIEWPA
jgi:predicted ATPase/DNA-binding SARP family transcriptional activator/Tfp pilus assembly protein PilF